MAIFRTVHNKNYTTVNNFICKDNRLSWKAKGIWLYAFSRPDDWVFYMKDLEKHATDGKDSLRSGLRELQECGYLVKNQQRTADGSFSNMEWNFFETPQEVKKCLPETENPFTDNLFTANPPLLSTECLISTEKKQQQAAPAAAVFFDCLKDLDIPEFEKAWISSNHTESEVIQAIQWINHPSTVIKTSIIQALKWACKEKPELPKKDEEIINENKRYMQQCNIEKKLKPHLRIDIARSYLEIVYLGCQKESYAIEFTDKKFKEKLTPFFE